MPSMRITVAVAVIIASAADAALKANIRKFEMSYSYLMEIQFNWFTADLGIYVLI